MRWEKLSTYDEAVKSSQTVGINVRSALRYAKDWDSLSPDSRDALDRLATAMARIASGHPDRAGSWGDIKKIGTLMLDMSIEV